METSGRHGRRGRTCVMTELAYTLRRHRRPSRFQKLAPKKTCWSSPTARQETAVVNDQTARIRWAEYVPRLVLQLQILSRWTQTLAKLQIHSVLWKNFRVGRASCVEREFGKLHRNWTAVHHVCYGTCSVIFAPEKACRLGAAWREIVTLFGVVAKIARVRFVKWTCVH